MADIDTALTWADVLADPSLQGLPYKIELDEGGRVVMSPAKNRHGMVQAQILIELHQRSERLGGKAWIDGSVKGRGDAVHVADVVWMSAERLQQHGAPDPMHVAPEICVEVRSPSNRRGELTRKVEDYLAAGAHEVWVVDLDGNKTVHRQPAEPPPA